MSAIIGLFRRDRQPVSPIELDRMLSVLAHRGPDEANQWRDATVGLGQCMLRTTLESLHEHLPFVHRSGEFAITADARIDNRDELISMLDLRDRPADMITDSQLILAAYERWGEQCPTYLLGDFAFAIWDARNQHLFCARDQFGVRPFYYYHSERLFAFASEIKAILELDEVPRKLNEQRVADYLVGLFEDTTGTFYQHIVRLPPAHALVVNENSLRMQRYWSLDPNRELRLKSDADYVEAFRAQFSAAVRSRLRSNAPVASLLSGGLDSSSIVGFARQILASEGREPLHTFSAIFDEVPECDERPFINQVLGQGGLVPHFVHGDHSGPMTYIESMLEHMDEPFFGPGLFLNWELYQAIHQNKNRILLDGDDGDGVVSHGLGYLVELASSGNPLTLAREMYGSARVFKESFWQLWWGYMWKYRLQNVAMHAPMLAPARYAWRALPRRRANLSQTQQPVRTRPSWRTILAPEFAQSSGVDQRWAHEMAQDRDVAHTERAQHYHDLNSGVNAFGIEVLDKLAAAWSIELRHPFWDRRLVEFCLSLPPEQKLHDGWGRLIMRRTMEQVVPKQVAWRRAKTNFFPNFVRSTRLFEPEQFSALMDISGQYISNQWLQTSRQQWLTNETLEPRQLFALLRVATLNSWMQQRSVTV